jgi:uncharacterized protein YerC
MARLSKYPLTADVWEVISDDYYDLVASLSDKEEIKGFFEEFFTTTEKVMFIKRFAVALLLSENFKYEEITKTLKVSPSTIFTVQNSLNRGIYISQVLEKIKSRKNIKIFFKNIANALLLLKPPGPSKKDYARFLNPDFTDFKEQKDWDRKRKTLVWETTNRSHHSLR